MGYYDLLNNFYDLLQSNPLSSSAQLLYYTLLQINNKCGWIEWFQRTNINICGLTRINEKTLISCRNELKQSGLINFISSKKKGDVTKYKILGCKIDGSNYSRSDSLSDSLTTVELTVEPPDIKDLDIDKDKNTSVATDIATDASNLDKNKEINKPSREKSVVKEFDVNGIEYKVSKYLAESITERFSSAKVPKTDNELFKWCEHVDKLIRIDKRPVDELWSVLMFAVKDSFWSANILSTQKFRLQYDKLYLKMQKDKPDNKSSKDDSYKQKLEETMAIIERRKRELRELSIGEEVND